MDLGSARRQVEARTFWNDALCTGYFGKKLAPFKVLEMTNKRVHIEWLQPDIRPGQQEEPMMRGSYCLYSQRGPLKQKQRKKKESGPAEQASTGAKTGAKGQ
eukprot:g53673.t1